MALDETQTIAAYALFDQGVVPTDVAVQLGISIEDAVLAYAAASLGAADELARRGRQPGTVRGIGGRP
jgi:hypothetical protein